jgi:Zn-finger protein
MELDSVLAKPIFTFPKNGTFQIAKDSIIESPLHYNVSTCTLCFCAFTKYKKIELHMHGNNNWSAKKCLMPAADGLI